MDEMRHVIVCTAHKGVFYGLTRQDDDTILTTGRVRLLRAKMAIYWGTTKGVMQLAHTGPTSTSRISAPADISLSDVIAVFTVTDEAAAVWAGA